VVVWVIVVPVEVVDVIEVVVGLQKPHALSQSPALGHTSQNWEAHAAGSSNELQNSSPILLTLKQVVVLVSVLLVAVCEIVVSEVVVVLEVVVVVEIEQNSQLVSHFRAHSQVGQKTVKQRSAPAESSPSWQTRSSSGKK